MRVISIDPGYERMGVAVIEKIKGKENLLFSDCIKTSPGSPHFKRLLLLGNEINRIIGEYHPDAMAMETLFFKNNQKTVMSVSEARGVALYEAGRADIGVAEYTPLQIKIAVTGYGRSEKPQVTAMVKKLIGIKKEIKYDDEYDAIAVGLTFFATHRN